MCSNDIQAEVVEFLTRPDAYPHAPAAVEHLQTPISHVFVAPPFAYKLKKPVTLSFLDFGTLDRRRAVCEDEVALNRRLCEPIYLGVVSVTRRSGGGFELDGAGDAIEHLVWMRALPAEGMLPVALEEGRVGTDCMRRFGRALADFHAAAPREGPRLADAKPENLRRRWEEVLENCAALPESILPPADRYLLADFGPRFLSRHGELFAGRAAAGRIREGHGDLHSANLCLVETALPAVDRAPRVEPGLYAFDCIEFSETLRWNDVASEVAFLAMDLEVHGHRPLSEAFVAAYVQRSGDGDSRLLLPYYAIHRACVRGMVHGQTAVDQGVSSQERHRAAKRAAAFFSHAARGAWHASGPLLIACCGLSGTGKTTLAARIAERTGLVHLSSDEIRKRQAGLDPFEPTPVERSSEIYRPEARRQVYEALVQRGTTELRAGRGVIADATFTRRAERDRIRDLAKQCGVPHVFVECTADRATIRTRLSSRSGAEVPSGHGARSDADWDTYRRQVSDAEPLLPDEPFLRVDTADGPLGSILEATLSRLWDWQRALVKPPQPRFRV